MASGSGTLESHFACEHSIEEGNEENKGQSALFCEGIHKRWAQVACVGISGKLYQELGECDSPRVYTECMKFVMASINDLAKFKSEVVQLSKKN